MFDTLLVSHATRAPRTRAVTVALIFHILLIAAAVSRTASPPAGLRPVARDTIRLELAEVRPSPEFEVLGFDPGPVDLERPLLSYQLPGQRQFDPGLLLPSPGAAGGSTDTIPLVFDTTELDELPELLAQPNPRFPDGLRRAGVSGLVQLQFVVGIDGEVDERSVRVLTSSHPGFTLAAFQALRESRFRPARRGGRPAAALVQQTIRFSYR